MIGPLVAKLGETAKAIDGHASERGRLWKMGARLPDAERADHGLYNQVELLTNWQRIVAEQFTRLRDKHGLKF